MRGHETGSCIIKLHCRSLFGFATLCSTSPSPTPFGSWCPSSPEPRWAMSTRLHQASGVLVSIFARASSPARRTLARRQGKSIGLWAVEDMFVTCLFVTCLWHLNVIYVLCAPLLQVKCGGPCRVPLGKDNVYAVCTFCGTLQPGDRRWEAGCGRCRFDMFDWL